MLILSFATLFTLAPLRGDYFSPGELAMSNKEMRIALNNCGVRERNCRDKHKGSYWYNKCTNREVRPCMQRIMRLMIAKAKKRMKEKSKKWGK